MDYFDEQSLKDLLRQILVDGGISLDIFPFDWLCTTDFFRAPASSKYHGAYSGGLFKHSAYMTSQLVAFTALGLFSPWQRPGSPVIVGLLHDVVKLGKYQEDPQSSSGYSTVSHEAQSELTHGERSVQLLKEHMQLTQEEEYCIKFHMGAYETEQWDEYDRAIKEFPNVLWTHTADMVASKILGV